MFPARAGVVGARRTRITAAGEWFACSSEVIPIVEMEIRVRMVHRYRIAQVVVNIGVKYQTKMTIYYV
jgi:hypothetical protein